MTFQTRVNKTLITSNDLDLFMRDVKGYIERMNEEPVYSSSRFFQRKNHFTPNRRELSMVEEIAQHLQD